MQDPQIGATTEPSVISYEQKSQGGDLERAGRLAAAATRAPLERHPLSTRAPVGRDTGSVMDSNALARAGTVPKSRSTRRVDEEVTQARPRDQHRALVVAGSPDATPLVESSEAALGGGGGTGARAQHGAPGDIAEAAQPKVEAGGADAAGSVWAERSGKGAGGRTRSQAAGSRVGQTATASGPSPPRAGRAAPVEAGARQAGGPPEAQGQTRGSTASHPTRLPAARSDLLPGLASGASVALKHIEDGDGSARGGGATSPTPLAASPTSAKAITPHSRQRGPHWRRREGVGLPEEPDRDAVELDEAGELKGTSPHADGSVPAPLAERPDDRFRHDAEPIGATAGGISPLAPESVGTSPTVCHLPSPSCAISRDLRLRQTCARWECRRIRSWEGWRHTLLRCLRPSMRRAATRTGPARA